MQSYELELFHLILREGIIITFLDSLENGIVIVDSEGTILFANKKALTKVSMTLSEVRGRKVSKLIPFANLQKVLSEGINYSNARSTHGDVVVYTDVCAIEINHNIIGAIMVLNDTPDITDYVNTLKISRTITRELETIYNSACDEIIVTDAQGIIMKISALYENLYDLGNSGDFVGKNVTELERLGLFNPSVISKVLKERKRISITQTTNSGKVLVVTGYPIFDTDENLISVVSMAKDITELHLLRSKLEEAKRINEKYYYQLEAFRQNESDEEKLCYKSKEIERIMVTVHNVAQVDSNVLITGESGVGKSLFAEYIHEMSKRKRELFVSINCGAIPETLLESELFGYEKGAFTGASKTGKLGKIDLANKGTLFLDEISELPYPLQVKLLKVIQEKKYTRVGGTETISSDFRLIAASNKDLRELVRTGKFREDLFYRLNVIPIEIPPLRQRKEDIVALTSVFWERLNKKYGTNRKLDNEVYDILTEYDWPGNVRELENCIERIMVTVNKDYIRASDLPLFLLDNQRQARQKEIVPLKKALEDTEKSLIIRAYKQYRNTYKVAEMLGVSQSTIVRKLNKYGCKLVEEDSSY